jgi:hypothetical protein
MAKLYEANHVGPEAVAGAQQGRILTVLGAVAEVSSCGEY